MQIINAIRPSDMIAIPPFVECRQAVFLLRLWVLLDDTTHYFSVQKRELRKESSGSAARIDSLQSCLEQFVGIIREPLVKRTDFQKRLLAAIWFAAFALLGVALMFHTLALPNRRIFSLYVLLPAAAGGIAGGLCGTPIANRTETNTVTKSSLRGIVVAAAAYAIFSLLFALTLPFIENGWSGQFGGLFLLTLTYGIPLAAPIVLLGGMLAGATLYLFAKVANE
jgi:hypothetical protein